MLLPFLLLENTGQENWFYKFLKMNFFVLHGRYTKTGYLKHYVKALREANGKKRKGIYALLHRQITLKSILSGRICIGRLLLVTCWRPRSSNLAHISSCIDPWWLLPVVNNFPIPCKLIRSYRLAHHNLTLYLIVGNCVVNYPKLLRIGKIPCKLKVSYCCMTRCTCNAACSTKMSDTFLAWHM